MIWNNEQNALIKQYGSNNPCLENLTKIPLTERRYKCDSCKSFFKYAGSAVKCPECGNTDVRQMCPIDNTSNHGATISGVESCPICGSYICPDCGNHDVTVVSRVTGYLSDFGNWNAAKQQEFKDRTRYDIEGQ